jgi:transcriptional regulator with XRE-family HTH domain
VAARNLSQLAIRRRAAGYSQESLAFALGLSRITVHRWEHGETEPEPWNRPALAEALSITLDELDGLLSDTRRPSLLGGYNVQALAMVVEQEHAHLTYDGATYTAFQRRLIRNIGTSPISRYLVRISVDRYPGSSERSNQFYRSHPLTCEELQLEAWMNDGEPLAWSVHHDRDAFKELWLLFENEQGRYPLYPGDATWLHYRYNVSDRKWGNWFQRAVRLPTQHLDVRLTLPADLGPMVWGTESSTQAHGLPLRTPINECISGDLHTYHWSTGEPPLHARYRLEWRFRARPESRPLHLLAG